MREGGPVRFYLGSILRSISILYLIFFFSPFSCPSSHGRSVETRLCNLPGPIVRGLGTSTAAECRY